MWYYCGLVQYKRGFAKYIRVIKRYKDMNWHLPALLSLVVLSGCTSLLPKGSSTSNNKGAWVNFEQISQKFDSIEVGKTTKTELYLAGFEPFNGQNAHILTFVDVVYKFMPSQNISFGDLPEGVKQCIIAKETCFVFTMEAKDIDKSRTGGFWADSLTFNRQTDTTGWKFSGFFIILDDKVVYKLMSAEPNMYSRDVDKKPLGPLQSFGSFFPIGPSN